MSLYVEVLLSTNTRKTDRPFTYAVPRALEEGAVRGALCSVPFGKGNRPRHAMVLRVLEQEKPDFPTKEILSWIAAPSPVSAESLALAEYMVDHDLSDYTAAIQTVLPPGKPGAYRPKMETFYVLTEEGKEAKPRSGALRQKKVLEALREGERSGKALQQETGADRATLSRLVELGWIDEREKRIARRDVPLSAEYASQTLTKAQQEVFDRITAETGAYVLCGVTGSGKTEIYLQLVERALHEQKQAIVLVPEISLTPQTIARFEGRFGRQVAILHSRLSQAERYEEWEKIVRGDVSIAIGARSAIFAPFPHLGMIIIDEEHESSYVSEKNPKYHTDRIAAFRAHYHHCSLVLGSATPSMETLYRTEKGELTRLDLRQRIHNLPMPKAHIIDMREELKHNNRSMFSRALYEAVHAALQRKEQIILFLNKRGHTSFVFCRACGYVYRCDACDVAMTYHKHRDKLICHYCGREKAYARQCPQCGSKAIREFGAGTEQLEEEVRRLFPQARVRRADADTMQRKGAYEAVYQGMLEGNIDILVGTQMIAKGFDFPRVTVVGILSADVNLNLPDLRAAERTFQLITQVAGRAGRADRPGEVFIQTYTPEHYALQAAATYDVDAFYQKEIAFRQSNGYPPACHALHIQLSSVYRDEALKKGHAIRRYLDMHFSDVACDGPTPSVIERMNRRYRFSLQLWHASRTRLEAVGHAILSAFPTEERLWITVTLDPLTTY